MTQTSESVGFVGLGAMGAHMAKRLLDAGHRVTVYDTQQPAVERVVAAGAQAAASARAVADSAATVLVSLPLPEVVAAVASELVGGDSIRRYVDLSTTGPHVAAEVAEMLAAAGIGVVDAPVSGGIAGAEQGKLTIMAAGATADVEAVRPLLDVLGSTIFVVGEQPGNGQTVKVINNLMSACSIAITSEAAALAAKSGVDPKVFLDVVAVSSGANQAAQVKFPQHVLTRGFHQGFRLNLMAKDVRLALSEARRHEVPLILGGTVEQLWNLGEATFAPDADFMEIVQMFERWAGCEIKSES
jgi:3-hydroxyisobutyrate dehydrogenase-like beta-hydroxyacid dehydrogenase